MTNYIHKVQLKYIEVALASSSSEGWDWGVVFLFVSGQAVQNYLRFQNTHICRHSIRVGFAELFLCPIGF